jgi:hypothetical protein
MFVISQSICPLHLAQTENILLLQCHVRCHSRYPSNVHCWPRSAWIDTSLERKLLSICFGVWYFWASPLYRWQLMIFSVSECLLLLLSHARVGVCDINRPFRPSKYTSSVWFEEFRIRKHCFPNSAFPLVQLCQKGNTGTQRVEIHFPGSSGCGTLEACEELFFSVKL